MPNDHEHAVCGEVVQEDREAAAQRLKPMSEHDPIASTAQRIRAGKFDDHSWVQAFARHRIASVAALTAEVEQLKREVAAYRLLAVNEGWSHRLVDAYGHAEYAAQHIEEIDRKARGTIASGYNAQKWLDEHSRALAGEVAGPA